MTWLCNLQGSDHEVYLHCHVVSVIKRMSICWSHIKVEISVLFSVLLHTLRIEASHTETTGSFCAVRNRMCINYMAPIHSGMSLGANALTGIYNLDHMLFSLTSSMCSSPKMVCADAKAFNSRNDVMIF